MEHFHDWISPLTLKRKRVTNTNILFWVNIQNSPRKGSIKATFFKQNLHMTFWQISAFNKVNNNAPNTKTTNEHWVL